MTHYSDITVRLNGEPLCTAESVTVSEAPDAREPLPPFHATFRCTADVNAIAAMFDAVRLPPSQPRGYVTIPYGILGPIRLQGAVDATACTFQMAENEVRRAMSMAVQWAIGNCYERDRVALRALEHADARVRGMARALAGDARTYRRPGGLYRHGEKKWRKAMRRLLRAAGILGGGQ